MKGLLVPFDFEGKGVLDLELLVKNKAFFTENIPAVNSSYLLKKNCFVNHNNSSLGEPISVLNPTIPGAPTSSSTLSSSHGGGGASADTAGVGAVSDKNSSPSSPNAGGADSEFLPVPPFIETGAAAADGGGVGGDDWGNALSATSPHQEQSIFGWIMEDTVEDTAIANLNKVLQIGGGASAATVGLTSSEFEFGGAFGVVDQGDQFSPNLMSAISSYPNNRSIAEKTDLLSSITHISPFESPLHQKLPIFNLINEHQAQHTQNPSIFSPFPQEQSHFGPPQAKRPNLGGTIPATPGAKWSFSNTRQQDMLAQQCPHQLLPLYPPPQRPNGQGPNHRMGELVHIQQQQQTIVDQLYNVAELVQTGNFVLAQGILARLNHVLSPIGNPFNRAAFYCKEALQLLLQTNNNNLNPSLDPSLTFSLIFKIDAYKLFSEISPLTDFTNFTCNQALLEALEGFERIHIVDFDIGYGGQWASFMQELALRPLGPPVLKITVLVASQSSHNHLELDLVQENLTQFASEVNIEFEFEVTSLDSLNSDFFSVPENVAVAVNFPSGCISNFNVPLALALRFVKQMSPRIVVSVDRSCDRTDLPFASHVIHALQSYSNILESLDAVNVNSDALQKIERFLIQPGIERVVTGRVRWPEKSQHWRNLFLSSGFSPVAFSNFAESQGECVVKRTPVRGFLVEKRQMSLVLSWQRKELVSASVWRC